MWSACVLCALLALAQARSEGKLVQTEQGPVRGYPSPLGDYFEFFGIPYATAPKGNHKFKAPLKPPSWSNIFEATNDKIACLQPNIGQAALYEETEDCLIVNVFVPKKSNNTLQVMVYIHGGAYFTGAGNMVTHEAMLRENVIVANFNYRLGTYGFLCLGTKDIPGNAGMKDQVAALRWVKRNIARFGGDPNDVTIGGYSAGSSSVEHLMLSPMGKGLFTKVIAESGSSLSPWAMTPDPIAMAKRYMKDISGKSSDAITEIEAFFKSLTSKQLTEKSYFVEPEATFGFVPCVESRIEGEESFYNEPPIDILKRGYYNKVPLMAGFAREEGLFRIDVFDQWSVKMNENFADFIPQNLIFNDENEKKNVAAKMKRFYFNDAPVGVDNVRSYVNFITDSMCAYPMVRFARQHALTNAPVYLYDYSYVLSTSTHVHSDKIRGATHSEQTSTVHKFFPKQRSHTPNDRLMESRLAKMWTNFAKYGVPVPTISDLLPLPWDTLHPYRLNYLNMDLRFQAKDHVLGERMWFWDELYAKYYREPVSPSVSSSHCVH